MCLHLNIQTVWSCYYHNYEVTFQGSQHLWFLAKGQKELFAKVLVYVCVCGVTSCLLNMISQQTYMVHELLVVKLLAGFVVIEQGQRSFVVTICQNMTSYVSKQANWTSVGLDECKTWAVGAQFIMSTTPLAVEVKGHLRSTEGKIWCPFVRKLTQ